MSIQIKKFPKLYKKTSTGAIQEWKISIRDGDYPILITNFGQVGGKIQESCEKITEGKNIGKKNETSLFEQANLQAEAYWKDKLKKGYVETIEDAQQGKLNAIIEGGIVPMLAHKFSEQGHKIKYPALCQPKLDGHRCIYQKPILKGSLWSRTRKPINSVPHIIKILDNAINLFDVNYLDGELYNHDYHNDFETLAHFIRQEGYIQGSEIIQYHVYDIPHPTFTNIERNNILQLLKPMFEGTPIHIVETLVVNSEDELMEAFEHFISLGYEGCMVRNTDGLYENKRSYNLLKIKEFDDSEFKIIGIKVGNKGSMAGKAVFTCDVPNVGTFDCKMKGKLEDLIQYADDPSLVIGKILTVKYQGFTKYGMPRFPVGLRFRED